MTVQNTNTVQGLFRIVRQYKEAFREYSDSTMTVQNTKAVQGGIQRIFGQYTDCSEY